MALTPLLAMQMVSSLFQLDLHGVGDNQLQQQVRSLFRTWRTSKKHAPSADTGKKMRGRRSSPLTVDSSSDEPLAPAGAVQPAKRLRDGHILPIINDSNNTNKDLTVELAASAPAVADGSPPEQSIQVPWLTKLVQLAHMLQGSCRFVGLRMKTCANFIILVATITLMKLEPIQSLFENIFFQERRATQDGPRLKYCLLRTDGLMVLETQQIRPGLGGWGIYQGIRNSADTDGPKCMGYIPQYLGLDVRAIYTGYMLGFQKLGYINGPGGGWDGLNDVNT
ncbi:hypothetical protein P692DRAFT_201811197 [Suillus brevipes Sb2]|nr:hypothetical protein P692DRAFT_201811197 [Suillus brevipes Sb2]